MNTAKFGKTPSQKSRRSRPSDASTLKERELQSNPIYARWQTLSPETKSIVRAVVVLGAYYITIAILFVPFEDDWSIASDSTRKFIDSMYFASVTISTVGYGDITPDSGTIQLCVGFLILVAFIFIANEVGVAVEVVRTRVAEKQKKMMEHQLSKMKRTQHPMDAEFIALGFKKPAEAAKPSLSPRMRKLVQSLAGLVANVFITHMVFWIFEDYTFNQALYGALATVTTVGYGDVSFTKSGTRTFAIFWLLVSPLNTLYCINGLVAVISDTVEDPDEEDEQEKAEQGAEYSVASVDTNSTWNADPFTGQPGPQSEVDFILSRWLKSELTERQMMTVITELYAEVNANNIDSPDGDLVRFYSVDSSMPDEIVAL
uniref:Potassium channel domain-containing protein n=1 Tax=Pyramimonas obovata TaxID=1411642 RepID=A0A7S0RGY6_9CHLO|mmetsp:Transcript_33687/g.73556  ORF Transcript_33687/g.73556 Transcript_33687/m.73556 type:complete len:373 (+) Transcript_33687:416-1534(+)|eukprot:CAMPEP_0118924294 /NCGR_PEP_ID=MMETSP1169-20130426/2492_1 /TAXON_ID=36882 /ORGANISM="Pyramimonas obovata, Strain CCMP722" /LENGTH=372 /DNA_ID=CAMNT_0006865391 /DNA_START=415 /DNA_END=1533 /DNA_ORIENTATION=+